MYRHLDAGWVLRLADGAHIPPDTANRDRAEFIAWQAEGGVAEPYEHPVPASVTRRQFKRALTKSRIRAAFEAAAAADPYTKDWYADSFTFERADPELAVVAVGIGKSEVDIDNLFKLAETL